MQGMDGFTDIFRIIDILPSTAARYPWLAVSVET